MTKLGFCLAFAFALLVGMSSVPSSIYAQTDEEATQPSEQPGQPNDETQSDESAKPDQSAQPTQGEDTYGKGNEEPDDQGSGNDDETPQDQE